MGPTALLPLRKKACWGFFSPRKIRRLRPGLNPRTWVPKASTLPLDHRSSFIKACVTQGRANNIRERAIFSTVGREASRRAKVYNNCLKQRTQLRTGNTNKRGMYTRNSILESVLLVRNALCSQLHPFQQTNASQKKGGWKLKKKIDSNRPVSTKSFRLRIRNHRFKVFKWVLLNQCTEGHWCTTRFLVEKLLGSFYGRNSFMFITKQTTLIQSNTTQVYYNSNSVFTCMLHVSACT